jgi:hypothetical protein
MKTNKPNFDPSSLPSGKGIGTKSKNASPNLVERGGYAKVWVKDDKYANPRETTVRDRGTNPGGSPRIEYDRTSSGKVSIDQLNNKGKFVKGGPSINAPSSLKRKKEGSSPKDAVPTMSVFGGTKATSMPVKNEQLNTIMDKNNKNLKIGNAKKTEKYIK